MAIRKWHLATCTCEEIKLLGNARSVKTVPELSDLLQYSLNNIIDFLKSTTENTLH